jgi:hypothetical protein
MGASDAACTIQNGTVRYVHRLSGSGHMNHIQNDEYEDSLVSIAGRAWLTGPRGNGLVRKARRRYHSAGVAAWKGPGVGVETYEIQAHPRRL